MADYQSIFEGAQIDEGIGKIINGTVDKAVLDAQAAAAQAAADAAKTASDRAVVDSAAGAETGRVTAESTRKTSETGRKDAETARVAAEVLRVEAEKAHTAAETARTNSETARITAENTRKTTETARIDGETARTSAENTRTAAETGRKDAEAVRATAEAGRGTAETARDAAEKQRATAETSRIAAETLRVAAEAGRDGAIAAKLPLTGGTMTGSLTAPKLVAQYIDVYQALQQLVRGPVTIPAITATTTLTELLVLAKQVANGTNVFALEGLTLAAVEQNDLFLRKNFHGDKFTDIGELKTAVKNLAKIPGGASLTNWNIVQYYIVNTPTGNVVPDRDIANTEANAYYWWQAGGSGLPYPYTLGVATADIVSVLEAAYRFVANGNVNAWGTFSTADIETLRLVESFTDQITWAELPKFDSPAKLETFKTAMETLANAASSNGLDRTNITWYQAQAYLHGKGFIGHDQATEDLWWWKNLDGDPSHSITPQQEFMAAMLTYIEAGYPNTGAAANAYNQAVADLFITTKLNLRWRATPASTMYISFDPADLSENTKALAQTQTNMRYLAKALGRKLADKTFEGVTYYKTASGGNPGEVNISWYQLQYYCYNMNTISSLASTIALPSEALAFYTNTLNGTWKPGWAKSSGAEGGAPFLLRKG